ncbi:MAG: hypothetical protein SBU_001069 [Candidatus Syntrophoarchaeum butanivorans]|uniref:Uncharacterized protein n=1 Tax=Candidatus Syntropharchaeum butanivorans TaxID=1839936 RepID=A0A1F2P567_9EURY|nr:MAG: hypothetical protein SBU_001069 [Candidatus Syntrophoarchaeum butanivorans]
MNFVKVHTVWAFGKAYIADDITLRIRKEKTGVMDGD